MHKELKHPLGLRVLFFTELWERFSYYTVQTLLILYMSEQLNLSDDRAFLLFGTFTALIYITPVIGGYLADKYFGFQSMIQWGGWLAVLGYIFVSLPSTRFFYLGLAVIIISNGLFKPNVTSILGDLYSGPEDHRRDPGFTIFYMGINMGSLIPPIFLGALVLWASWSVAFSIAAVGMVVAMIVYYVGRHTLGTAGKLPNYATKPGQKCKKRHYLFLIGGIILSTLVIDVLFSYAKEVNYFVLIVSLAFLVVLIYFLFQETGKARYRMGAALILSIISAGFWIFNAQQSTSIILFAKRNMIQSFLGIPLDAEGTLFFNPFYIIILSPLMSKLWIYLSEKDRDFSTPLKFALGVFIMAIAFLVLALGCRFFTTNALVSSNWVVLSYFFQSVAELLLSPVGLAMITAFSPHRHVGIMMGFWFLIQSAAYAIGSKLATYANVAPHVTAVESLPTYTYAFTLFFWLCFALAIISFFCIPFLNCMISDRSQ